MDWKLGGCAIINNNVIEVMKYIYDCSVFAHCVIAYGKCYINNLILFISNGFGVSRQCFLVNKEYEIFYF